MQESSVIQIVDENAKSGVSAKSGKPWSMSRVGLKNGESVFIFNPIEVGDVVEAVQNGDYTNWQKKKVDPKHDEIMKALRAIYAAVTTGATDDSLAKPAIVPEESKSPEIDTVHPVDDKIDPSQIPF